MVDADQFNVIFYVGGHGTMWDFPHDREIAELAATIYQANGVVAAVCHGPAGLTDVVPFLLEDELNKAGANHQAGPDFEPQTVVDAITRANAT